jgi:hypothetical protein
VGIVRCHIGAGCPAAGAPNIVWHSTIDGNALIAKPKRQAPRRRENTCDEKTDRRAGTPTQDGER